MFSFQKRQKRREPWNKGRLVGQKLPLTLQEIWSVRMRLQTIGNLRDLALFNLGIDSKLRACDLLALRVSDVANSGQVQSRATIRQRKTTRPVRFEITARTRESVEAWISAAKLSDSAYLFPSRISRSPHLSTRQYARILNAWVSEIGLDSTRYGTHSMRRTKATLIYRQTKNLRAVQLLLGHSKLDSTVRYLGIEIDDALEMSEQIDV
jgi:integrase